MTRKQTGFDNSKLKLRKEWLPDAEQLIEKSIKVDEKMQLLAAPPLINGKPFIWTEDDHKEVQAAYEGKKIDDVRLERKKFKDAITDGAEYGNLDRIHVDVNPIVTNEDINITIQKQRETDKQQRKTCDAIIRKRN